MDFELTEEQSMIRNMVRDFAEKEIIPVAREYDRQERFPWEIVDKMASLGWLGALLPAEYGGMGIDYISYFLMMEEIGRASFSLHEIVSAHISLVEKALHRWGNESQKEAYLRRLARDELLGCFAITEPNAGDDVGAIETSAVHEGDSWLINGNKTWITNGGVAGLALILVQTDKSKGHRGLTTFIVERETPGFSSQEIRGRLGLRSASIAELFLDGCRIPAGNLLGEIGQGMEITREPINEARLCNAAGCVGLAKACIDASIKYAQTRYQFGRPIGKFQLVQELIADMIVGTEASELLVYRAAHLHNKGIPNTTEVSIAKYFASENALRGANNAIQVHGAYGYCDEHPVERYFRDIRSMTIAGGTSQMQKLLIGRSALGMSAIVS